jgi:hypothetical protein
MELLQCYNCWSGAVTAKVGSLVGTYLRYVVPLLQYLPYLPRHLLEHL